MIEVLRRKGGRLLLVACILALLLGSTASTLAYNNDPNVLDIDGSTTVYPVVRIAMTQFPIDYPGTVMNVSATGSGHGQVSIMNAYVDIAMSSSRCSTRNEYVPTSGQFTTAPYTSSGVPSPYRCTDLTETIVARDGLTIIVNKAKQSECGGALTNITKTQIADIYKGVIKNWNQLNPSCPSSTLTPRARIIGSGTRQSLLEMLGSSLLTDAQEQATIAATGLERLVENADLEAVIAANKDQIGYGGMINVDPLVAALSVDGVAPTPENVSNGTYPLSRNLYLYTLPTSVNGKQRIQDFLNWILGVKGQAAVQNEGYVPVGRAAPNWDVNVDNRASVLDLIAIGGYWGQTGPRTGDPPPLPQHVRGWVRADVNFDGRVSVLDLTTVGGHWGRTW